MKAYSGEGSARCFNSEDAHKRIHRGEVSAPKVDEHSSHIKWKVPKNDEALQGSNDGGLPLEEENNSSSSRTLTSFGGPSSPKVHQPFQAREDSSSSQDRCWKCIRVEIIAPSQTFEKLKLLENVIKRLPLEQVSSLEGDVIYVLENIDKSNTIDISPLKNLLTSFFTKVLQKVTLTIFKNKLVQAKSISKGLGTNLIPINESATVTERPSEGRRRRISQVKLVSLKVSTTLYLLTKASPFLSQPSHTYGVKSDSRHRLSAVESRRVAKKTNHESRKRRLGQAVEKRTLYSQVAWAGRVEPRLPGIKVQPAQLYSMRPSPVIHYRD
ncbi:hypothetical protein M9H77_23334 [Catharanthus roseus]|uniref:Uncharacterized protein n=1 Tax=Catharanthus roseus TaxID=4058 RepID=A0ACC0ATQ9_CATRO|nr:hypothetical protein M9H77_23334 [Catharanthus roseus]